MGVDSTVVERAQLRSLALSAGLATAAAVENKQDSLETQVLASNPELADIIEALEALGLIEVEA